MVDQPLDRHRLRARVCDRAHADRHAGGADGARQSARAPLALAGGARCLALAHARIRAIVTEQPRSYRPHSGSIPASFTTCAHFLISAGMNRASSSGVLVQGVIASAFILSCVSVRLMKAVSRRLSLSMIGRGVPARDTTENQVVPPEPGTPASAMVGRSGIALTRVVDVTANAFTLPSLIAGMATARSTIIIGMWPEITSASAAALPR